MIIEKLQRQQNEYSGSDPEMVESVERLLQRLEETSPPGPVYELFSIINSVITDSVFFSFSFPFPLSGFCPPSCSLSKKHTFSMRNNVWPHYEYELARLSRTMMRKIVEVGTMYLSIQDIQELLLTPLSDWGTIPQDPSIRIPRPGCHGLLPNRNAQEYHKKRILG